MYIDLWLKFSIRDKINRLSIIRNSLYLIILLAIGEVSPVLANPEVSQLQRNKQCDQLEKSIKRITSNNPSQWGISILDSNTKQIVSINSSESFIPASNLKLFSTAYTLDKLGPSYRLKTQLYLNRDNEFELVGTGNPDLSKQDIKLFTATILDLIKNDPRRLNPPRIVLYEESREHWWPHTWDLLDRAEMYGSPVTRLAVSSNNIYEKSVTNPLSNLEELIISDLKRNGVDPTIIYRKYRPLGTLFTGRKLLRQLNSAPLNALLSLSNSESHNFTAEVLLRNAANSWEQDKISEKLLDWLIKNRISVDGIRISDGSGLSRDNRLTPSSITSLLTFMDKHKYSETYRSSMAIIGVRGTLIDFADNLDLNGMFYGKTGTLEGVRSLSGFMVKKIPNSEAHKNIYISIIANNLNNADNSIRQILNETNKFIPCS